MRDLLETAVGEPPRRVTVEAVRRRVIRRRLLEAAGIGAVAVVVAGIGAAAAFRAAGANEPSVPASQAGAPRYYAQARFPGRAGRQQPVVIRATATGAVTATVRCPWANSRISPQGVAGAGDRTFFMICQKVARQGRLFVVTGTRIYRFQLTRSGRIGGYSLVPGGALGRHRLADITAAFDGSQIALTVGQAALGVRPSAPSEVYVINTQTGARAIWRGGPEVFSATDLTFTHNGTALEFVGLKKCAQARGGAACQELRTVSPAAAGGRLDSSRVLLPLSALATHPGDYVNQVVINLGSATLDAGIVHSGRRIGSDSVSVVEYSAVNGRQLRVLYHMRTGNGFFYRFLTADPTGRHLIFDAGPTSGTINGWIHHGRLVRLTPADGSNVSYETW